MFRLETVNTGVKKIEEELREWKQIHREKQTNKHRGVMRVNKLKLRKLYNSTQWSWESHKEIMNEVYVRMSKREVKRVCTEQMRETYTLRVSTKL